MKKKYVLFFAACLFFSQNLSFAQKDSIFFGIATFYSDWFEGRTTSNGEIFRHSDYTAAHRTLKPGTFLKISNLGAHQAIIVKVNDRCPKRGILDLTKAAARKLGLLYRGTSKIQIEILGEDGEALWLTQQFLFTKFFDSYEKWKDNQVEVLMKNPAFTTGNPVENQMIFGYYLQIACIRDIEQVRTIALMLPLAYFPYLKAKKNSAGAGYNVLIGPFLNFSEVNRAKKTVKPFFPMAEIKEKTKDNFLNFN